MCQAEAYRRLGKAKTAESLYKQAVAVNPRNKWAYFALGRLYREQGELQQALAVYRQILGLDPEDRQALRAISEIEAQLRGP